MHIRTGDTVVVIRGEQVGERGEVQRVLLGRFGGRMRGKPNPNNVRVIVAGVNLITKHQRRTGNVRTQTGRIEREAPIHINRMIRMRVPGVRAPMSIVLNPAVLGVTDRKKASTTFPSP